MSTSGGPADTHIHLHLYTGFSSDQLAQILTALSALSAQETTTMSALDDQITSLTTVVTRNTSVEKSTLALVQAIPQLILDAVAKATAAGATAAQLTALTTLASTISSNDDELAAAVVANTPAATAPSPVPGA